MNFEMMYGIYALEWFFDKIIFKKRSSLAAKFHVFKIYNFSVQFHVKVWIVFAFICTKFILSEKVAWTSKDRC